MFDVFLIENPFFVVVFLRGSEGLEQGREGSRVILCCPGGFG